MKTLLFTLLQGALFLALAPLLTGIIKKVKAATQKRQGPPIIQMYLDLWKLFGKQVVLSDQSTWITQGTPMVVFGAVLGAALLAPMVPTLQGLQFTGDLIAFVYLLGMARFFMALGGLDAASTFGGMGSSREMMIGALFEPALMMTLFNLALFSHSLGLKAIFFTPFQWGDPMVLLSGAVLILVLLAETARIPIDDPSTHLELTMVHEAMLLEYTGPHLALMEWAAAVKQLILLGFLARLLIPAAWMAGPMVSALGIFTLGVILLAVVIAAIEANTVKLRLFTVPNLAAISFILSLVAFLQQFSIGRV